MAKGQFIWFDLMLNDAKAALAFYGHVIGWTSEARPAAGGGVYHVLSAAGQPVAGAMELTGEHRRYGMKPVWMGHIHSTDVDGDGRRIEQAGGKLQRAPQDIPEVGRFAPASDPQGAGFLIFNPIPPAGGYPALATGPGAPSWAELVTTDWKAGFAFYSELFGWTKDRTMDMGPMGTYQLFATGGKEAAGGMMNNPDPQGHAYWLYYFNVDGPAAAAAQRVKEKGGEVTHGPNEVAGPMWTLVCKDAQGASFGLVALKP